MKKRDVGAGMLAAAMLFTAGAGAMEIEKIGTGSNVDFVDGCSLLCVRGKNGYAMADINGQPLTEAVYTNWMDCEFGVVKVDSIDEALQPNNSGALRMDGTAVIPCAYGDIEVLSKDWAVGFVLKESTADNYDYQSYGSSKVYYIIDRVDIYRVDSGECVKSLPRGQYMEAKAVGDCLNIMNRADSVVTTYDAQMNALGTCEYIWEDEYATSSVPVDFYENRHYGLRDAQGNTILEPKYSIIYDFYGGKARVEDDWDKSGLIDMTGAEILPCAYDDVKSYYSAPHDPYEEDTGVFGAMGYYAVEIGGKLGFVREGGEVTCEAKLSTSLLELEGMSATYTDLEGNQHILAADGVDTVVPDGTDALYNGQGYFYSVEGEKGEGLINWHGEELLPCVYSNLEISEDGKYLMASIDYKECELYAIKDEAAPEAAEIPAEQGTAAEGSAISKLKGKLSGQAVRAEQAPAAEPSAARQDENSAAAGLLNSARMLLELDAAANAVSAAALLDNAAAMLGDAPAASMLTSASTLLKADAAGNAAAVMTLIDNAMLML